MTSTEKAQEIWFAAQTQYLMHGDLDRVAAIIAAALDAQIEECAKVAEGIAPRVSERPIYHKDGPGRMRHPVGDAIRALKYLKPLDSKESK